MIPIFWTPEKNAILYYLCLVMTIFCGIIFPIWGILCFGTADRKRSYAPQEATSKTVEGIYYIAIGLGMWPLAQIILPGLLLLLATAIAVIIFWEPFQFLISFGKTIGKLIGKKE